MAIRVIAVLLCLALSGWCCHAVWAQATTPTTLPLNDRFQVLDGRWHYDTQHFTIKGHEYTAHGWPGVPYDGGYAVFDITQYGNFTFKADAGILDGYTCRGVITVQLDGKVVWSSKFASGDPAKSIAVPLAGHQKLTLIRMMDGDGADLLEPRLEGAPGSETPTVTPITNETALPITSHSNQPVQSSPKSGMPDLVVLVKGTWNRSDYRNLNKVLANLNIPVIEYANLFGGKGLDDGKMSTATANAYMLLDQLQRECAKRPGVQTVDIVAHSFGGLVARRLAHLQANDPKPDFLIRNIITCGTPLRGLVGVDAINVFSVNQLKAYMRP